MSPRTRQGWARAALGFLLAAHLAILLGRAPRGAFHKRLTEISRFRQLGAARFHLDNEHLSGGGHLEWVFAHVPQRAALLWTGDHRGALEFVPALVFPRLLCDARAVPKGARQVAERPLAGGRLPDGRDGEILVVGHGDRIELSAR